MNCNKCCKNFYFVNSASLSGTNIVLNLDNTPVIADGTRLCFRFRTCVSIPAGSATYPVFIAINGANYPVWDKYGNVMTGAELIESSRAGVYCPRITYHAYYGLVDGAYHIIVHNIPKACGC